MSTRAVIRVYDFNDDCVAKYYVHHDGYPEAPGLGMELYELFRDIKRKRFKLISAEEATARIEWGIPRAERLKDWEVITDIQYMYNIFLKDKEIQVSQVYYDWRKQEYTAPIVNWVKDVWKFKKKYNEFISQHK